MTHAARGHSASTTGLLPSGGGQEDDVSAGRELTYQQLNLSVDGVSLTVATASRGGEPAPLVFLHGFGSTKEDYADIALQLGQRVDLRLLQHVPQVVRPIGWVHAHRRHPRDTYGREREQPKVQSAPSLR